MMHKENGWVVWLTGLPASGKTTVAKVIQQKLDIQGVTAILLDSDELRRVLTPQPSYTPEERDFFYSEITGLAELLAAQGVNVLIAATGQRRRYRDEARNRLDRFFEVWVRCSLDVCQERDPKGLYAQAALQQNENLPGVGVSYEPPQAPDTIIDTQAQSIQASAEQVIKECDLGQHDENAGGDPRNCAPAELPSG